MIELQGERKLVWIEYYLLETLQQNKIPTDINFKDILITGIRNQ